MRIFVTGATGFVGSAVVQNLLAAGHEVLGLARSDANAEAIAKAGAKAHRGALDDVESLKRGALETDGVIHTAYVHDFSNLAASGPIDKAAIEAIGDALAGSNRPFVVTSAIAVLPPGRLGREEDRAVAGGAGNHRVPAEIATLALASRGVRASVIRLPPSVHGDGDHGFVPALVRTARDQKLSAYVGDGANRWAAVHRLDVADLYRLALEKGGAGDVFHGIADEGLSMKDIATVIGKKLGVPVVSKSGDEATAHFTWLAKFAAADMIASSERTRNHLGWTTRQPNLLEDLEHGTYFA